MTKKDEQEVLIKNAELTLVFLRKKTNEEATTLSALYAEKIVVSEQIKQDREKFEVEKKEIEEARKVLSDEKASISLGKQQAEQAVNRATEEKRTIESQKNEAMKELSRMNDWILTAENQKKELEEKIKLLDEQSKEKSALVADIEEIKKERETESNKLSQTKLEISLMVDEANGQVEKADREVKDREAKRVELDEENGKAKIALDNLINEKLKTENDLKIYIERVEKKYNQAFPELKMNI